MHHGNKHVYVCMYCFICPSPKGSGFHWFIFGDARDLEEKTTSVARPGVTLWCRAAVNLLNVSIMAKHLLLQGKCQYLSVRRHTKHLAEGQKKIYSKIYERKKLYLSASHVLGCCNNKTSFQITVDCSFVAELSKYWY